MMSHMVETELALARAGLIEDHPYRPTHTVREQGHVHLEAHGGGATVNHVQNREVVHRKIIVGLGWFGFWMFMSTIAWRML